ncbi:hypothetical protein VTP01DRAFT_6978, partial [Rhizomucor pusillus]|uniref:uncharacterized protein n=1 Tax=Rhizomucor pusillus TaxID=4840 RepID=UPI0037440D89
MFCLLEVDPQLRRGILHCLTYISSHEAVDHCAFRICITVFLCPFFGPYCALTGLQETYRQYHHQFDSTIRMRDFTTCTVYK